MPGLNDIGEFGFIHRIHRQCLVRPQGIFQAIGDDAAAFWTKSDTLTLVTTDLLVERVHFLRNQASAFSLGWKALAVNMSDIAAMGGTAREAFVSLAIPDDCSLNYLDDLYQGMHAMCCRFGVNILGGDTTGSKQDLIINVALTGEVSPEEILCRDGAKPGELICSTGYLGDSRAGLHMIMNNIARSEPALNTLYQAHISPHPCLREGRFLASSRAVSSAMDVSDGLSSDLAHLCAASKTGARIEAARIPISDELTAFCTRFGYDPVQWALAGGEDYTLLFTVRPEKLQDLMQIYEQEFSTSFLVIGEMTDSQELHLVDSRGGVQPLESTGWNHFSKQNQ